MAKFHSLKTQRERDVLVRHGHGRVGSDSAGGILGRLVEVGLIVLHGYATDRPSHKCFLVIGAIAGCTLNPCSVLAWECPRGTVVLAIMIELAPVAREVSVVLEELGHRDPLCAIGAWRGMGRVREGSEGCQEVHDASAFWSAPGHEGIPAWRAVRKLRVRKVELHAGCCKAVEMRCEHQLMTV